jgi:hypothetical protein
MSKKHLILSTAFGSAIIGLVAAGCTSDSSGGGGATSGGGTAAPAAGGAAAKGPIDPATAGTISVKVKFAGTAPEMGAIEIPSTEKVCAEAHPQGMKEERVIVNADGTLANCFVYVKTGLEGRTFDAPKDPVVFDQKGCQYSPHVFGIQVGQQLDIKNSDPLLHNVHSKPKGNDVFNEAMPTQGMTISKKFKKPEVMVPIQCDVHSWMKAFAGVCDNPYFGVTGADGTVELKTLPPGDYTIEVWHEQYGKQTQKVTLGAKETKSVEFTVKG